MNTPESSESFAKKIRKQVLHMIHDGKSAHIGSNLSVIDIISVLYQDILNVRASDPTWDERDRFVLSKGHAGAAVYATLAEKKFFPFHWLKTYYQDGGHLAGHLTSIGIPGVEFSTGSLGHGLPVGTGMALAAKRDQQSWRTFVLLSDGECDEGSNWEAIMFAAHHKLDNLVAIVDYNGLQSLGSVSETLELEPFVDKWKSFGWSVKELDGHDHNALRSTFQSIPFEPHRPSCIIAHTTKGKGVPFMENVMEWHYNNVTDDVLARALAAIGNAD